MSTEIAHLRRRLVEFTIQCTTHLELPPIVKYSALSLFFDRFRPSVVSRFLQKKKKAEHWLLQPLTESNLQLFVLISIWISCKVCLPSLLLLVFVWVCCSLLLNVTRAELLLLQMHCSRGLSVQSLKSLGDNMITEQLFTVRDFMEAELVFLKVMKFEIGTLNIAYTLLDDLFIHFKEVAKVGELLNFEACMDMMDLLYEKEETSVLYHSSTSLAASILVSSYIITVPKQQWEFPILPWATALSELWLITTRGVFVLGVKMRLSRVVGEVRTFVGWVSFPGDGGFHRSVDAGSSYRGVEVSFASPSSAQVLGRRLGGFGAPTKVSCGEVIPVVFRDGGGQVEADAMRVGLMVEMHPRVPLSASLTCGSSQRFTVKMVTNKEEREVVELVGYILSHVLYPHPS
ncbi:hypothetical protein HID58_076516 [Brassica napus]|uniref:Cyclin N-terminal domain-containing protein n=1 Tax=Brassica napus TaxID=3708 RepID=A0ABQ7YMQ3_BRANA|nr:hypothetical protein HID58_076516 [Brassica napus]